MYEAYYGLKERPFDLSPNPRFLFLSARHNEALTHLRYGLSGRPGLTVLVGDAGTGKTTLVKTALQANAAEDSSGFGGLVGSTVVHLSNPTLTRDEFYEFLAAGFGFSPESAKSKSRFLRELETSLSEQSKQGRGLALIVDEAQSLPHALLEEIRLLTNVETAGGQTLTLIMVGQPELADRLNEPQLRQLKQRIALRCELTPLSLQETAAYVAARILVAGGAPEVLFSKSAIAAVHEHSRGIPRTISVICDNALVSGFAAEQKPVTRDIVLEVCRDFEFGSQAAVPAGSAAPPVPRPRPVKSAPVSPLAPADEPAIARNETATAAAAATTGNGSDADMFSGFTRRRRFLFF